MAIDIVEILRQTALVEELTDTELRKIVPICREHRFPAGSEIFAEASKGRELYIVCDGRVSIEVALPDRLVRQTERLATALPGMVFGEFSLVDGSPRSAMARALDDAIVLEIASEDLQKTMEANPRIGYIIMRNLATVLCARLRSTNLWLRNELIWSR